MSVAHHPKGQSTMQECPHCGKRKLDEGVVHGHTRAGLPWCGHYDLFACGLMLVARWDGVEMFHPCDDMLEGVARGPDGKRYNAKGKRVIDTEAELGEARDPEPAPEIFNARYILSWDNSATNATTGW